MKTKLKTVVKIFASFPLVFCIILGLFLSVGVDTADAVLPSSYVEAVKENDSDWQSGENYLDIDALKATVSGWFADSETYDFSALEDDPIIIAVIDTGVNFNHEIFQGKYDSDGNPVSSSSTGEYDVFLRDSSGNIICKNTALNLTTVSSITDEESNHHGTHVCGIIAIMIHELDLEKYVKILPIRASSGTSSSFTSTNVKSAVNFALANGADIINLSLGDDSSDWASVIPSDAYQSATIVAAAGNNSANIAFYPAAASNVVGVMNYASDGEGGIEAYSSTNYGSYYDLFAPGGYIWSADGATADEYKSMSGTSMATPVVSFAGALIALKYRACESVTEYEISADVVKNMLCLHSSQSLSYKGSDYKVLDIVQLITIDFLNDANYSYIAYSSEPTGVTVSGTNLSQTLGSVGESVLTAEVQPTDCKKDVVINWYLVSGTEYILIGQGTSVNYTPENSVGTYTVVAKIEGTEIVSDNLFISVKYATVSASTATLNISGNLTEDNKLALGEEISVSIDGIENANQDTTSVMWYVNGSLVSNSKTFTFSSIYAGSYVIAVKLNGVYLPDSITVIVDESLPYDFTKVYTPLETFSMFAVAAILLGVAIAIIVLWVKGKKLGIFK